MWGKKASALRVEHILRDLRGVVHVATSALGPGALTHWFVAWTFSGWRHTLSCLAWRMR
jgi:hypothetical protein